MNNKNEEFEWEELKNIWANSSETKHISIQLTALADELRSKVSAFEKDSIKADLASVQANWTQVKRKVSQFEKDSVRRDLKMVTKLIKSFLNLFKKNE